MATGTRVSYTDTTNTKRSIGDTIYMIDWTKAPLLHLLKFDNSNVKKFKLVNWPNTKAELLHDTMRVEGSTMSDGSGIDSTTTTIGVTTGDLFRKGDMVAIHASSAATSAVAETVMVTAVSSNNLTVIRAWDGDFTTGSAHSDGVYMSIITRAMPEANDFTTGYTTTTSAVYNYTQILSEAVKVSKTRLAISNYGVDDEMDYQVSKLFADGGSAGDLAKKLARTFYRGQRVQRTSTNYGSMGGFKTFVTTNVTNLSSAAIVRADIHKKIRDVRTAGGEVTHLLTGAWGMEKITAMYEDSIRTTRDETIGGAEIQVVRTPHGEVRLVYDWMCPESEYYFFNIDKLGWLPLRPFDVGEIKEQGDYMVTDVVGEYTFLLCDEKSHGYIYGASITS